MNPGPPSDGACSVFGCVHMCWLLAFILYLLVHDRSYMVNLGTPLSSSSDSSDSDESLSSDSVSDDMLAAATSLN